MAVALITGGGSGLGAVLAERLASRGHDLLLVSRDSARAHTAARSLAGRYGVRADVLVTDLATRRGLFRLEALLTGPEAPAVDVLVHDAASEVTVAAGGVPSVDDRQALVDLGVTATMRLTHAALPGMLRRGTGTVLAVGPAPAPGDTGGEPGTVWATAFTASLAATLDGSGVRAAVVRADDRPERALAVLDAEEPAAAPDHPSVLRDLPRRAVGAGVRAARRGAELLSDATREPLMPAAAAPRTGSGPSVPRRDVAAPGCGHAPEELLAGAGAPAAPVRAPSRLPDLPTRPGAGRSTAAASGCGRSTHFVAGSLRTAEQRSRATAAARDRARTRHVSPHGSAVVSGT
ncbi:Short-chain dehydrogenase/reductase SDR [Pseudonocardia sp. Ae168_Ps1]|uniref:SDR family NAD(P)-dependent oxidoreductase n=1 Tax=unclassified Pseudonocardia TaxID=2619320 RepID=UPI0009635B6F|nr:MULTISPECIES: SDR family NAD(P)-dependent oxidoreductase [unclassified Pseudonocardia]OLL74873.1 Short-chain dehydrogenase/reductase SDR [Pseudonocardia sp. Ae150A_Ps1]OLL80865.1 Short-chain dehydrogenase/reductase SDR [Pseudonocardia sp. Ae168_Ps1]OLL85017.1 Short-chain dehydrogenase/reductase SDR [Pseudonocardia sp. Ae263_Ps1]OLL94966.1 Short-chain dehydrogenase/reductase SDR [Pseudonocardia sp. Ae356_Ps1]